MEDATVILSRSDAPRQVILADAIAVGVLPTWTEAVALVRAIAWQLYRAGGSAPVPELSDIAIFSTGVVHLEGGYDAHEGQIAGVGHIMSRLLEHVGAPPQVLDVRAQAMATPPVFATLMEMHNALDFFARPDAKAVLADFHARAIAAIEDSSQNQALEDLKEKTKSTPRPEKKKTPARKKPPKWAVVAAGVLLATVAAAAAYFYAGGSSNPAVSQTANVALTTITETGKKLQDATNDIVSKLVGGASVEPATPVNASPADVTPPAPRRRAPETPLAGTPQVASTSPPVPPRATVSTDMPPAPAPVPVPTPEPPPIMDAGVYSARDKAVLAPVLVYPQLPTKPIDGAMNTNPGSLDILVLEDGTVAEARLIPQSDRLQDRMMVSAAKAWRFRPAVKDGRSVRYRVRIPITW